MESSVMNKAKANLVLFHNVSHPTDQQAALFALYGETAPFIVDGKQACRMNTNKSGGTFTMNITELERALSKLRGTSRLLTSLCNEPATKDLSRMARNQEALFRIEEMLRNDVSDLEEAIYNK